MNEKLSIQNGKPTFSTSKPDSYEVCVKEQCTLAKEKEKQCECGRETFSDAGGKVSKLSLDRCDPKYKQLIANAAGGQASQADISNFALQQVTQQAVQNIDPSTDVGKQQLSELLQGVGVQGATKEVVDSNPQAAYELIQKIAAGDQAGAQSAATTLGLNADLGDIATMQAQLPQTAKDTLPQQQMYQAAVQTGFGGDVSGEAPQPQVLSRDVLYSGQGQCYSVANSFGAHGRCVLTADQLSQIQGNVIPQVASVYWEGTRTANGESFNPNGLTVASPSLPFGTQVMVYNPNTGLAVVATVNDRGPFVSGRDIDLSSGTARAIGFSGVGTLQTVVLGSSMQAGALTGQFPAVADALQAYQSTNGAIAIGAGNIDTSKGAPQVSPFASLSSGNTAGVTNPYGSPFANLTPAPIARPAVQSQSFAQLATQPSQTGVVSPVLIDTTQLQPVQPAALILAQPQSVVRGNQILVSWSSVGMSANPQCRIVQGSSLLAQANAGSQNVPTDPFMSAGTLTFTMTCTTQAGQTLQQSASVTLK